MSPTLDTLTLADVDLLLDAARVGAIVNATLLLVLIGIWSRNYREIRAPLTLGSIVFATLLLAENAVALYTYLNPPEMSPPAAEMMMILQILETVGIAVLTYVTWQ